MEQGEVGEATDRMSVSTLLCLSSARRESREEFHTAALFGVARVHATRTSRLFRSV